MGRHKATQNYFIRNDIMIYRGIIILVGMLFTSCSNPIISDNWDLVIHLENQDSDGMEIRAYSGNTRVASDVVSKKKQDTEMPAISGIPDYSGEYMSDPIVRKEIFGAILSIQGNYSEVDIYIDVNRSRFQRSDIENNPQEVLVGKSYKSNFRLNTNSFRRFLFIKSDEQLDVWLGDDANYPKVTTKDNGDGWQYIVLSNLPSFITIEGKPTLEVGVNLHFNEGKGGKDAFIVD